MRLARVERTLKARLCCHALFVALILIDFELIEPVLNGLLQFLSQNNEPTATIPLVFVFYTIEFHQVHSFSS